MRWDEIITHSFIEAASRQSTCFGSFAGRDSFGFIFPRMFLSQSKPGSTGVGTCCEMTVALGTISGTWCEKIGALLGNKGAEGVKGRGAWSGSAIGALVTELTCLCSRIHKLKPHGKLGGEGAFWRRSSSSRSSCLRMSVTRGAMLIPRASCAWISPMMTEHMRWINTTNRN